MGLYIFLYVPCCLPFYPFIYSMGKTDEFLFHQTENTLLLSYLERRGKELRELSCKQAKRDRHGNDELSLEY